ncbi:lytic transglycosylase domain-containing protein [Palleronia sp. LCG004]|uniref:lytic transglycosylase domain-containing protein n=1 Tax=Palleronia sp. LCG004 TaxID=3079304 RepID=UPI002942E891|nr:lytic transglycosylase domain-containing protein [Palleronia sp. LCG004]WOI55688.1 lytic transglycosylase domain-containing protein [Palleronia sp. LCG004]
MRHPIFIAIIATLLGAVPVQADSPVQADFTFKRVKPPAPGTTKRITVQIDPSVGWPPPLSTKSDPKVEEERAPVIATDAPVPVPPGSAYSWFWNRVPTSGGGMAGLGQALATLARPPADVAAPQYRLATLQRLADRHGQDILRATVGTRVSPALALAVMAVESNGRVDAVSSAGAQGLMQLMPATASRFGVRDSRVASQNIAGGVAYLDWLMGHFDGDPLLVLAGYNAGEGAVAKHAGVPPYAETRGYVPKVLAAFQVAKGLCLTPPMLVSDGCVFVGSHVASSG